VPTGDTTGYKCKDGDAFVSGVLKGKLTIGAINNIILVGNTTYNTAPPGGTDILGLIADNFIEIYHPVSGGANVAFTGGPVTTVHAAILSLGHSFRVQNFGTGAVVGNLSVRGAIGQRFRGPVGTLSGGVIVHGYAKDYVYDTRLKYISPPHFLDPIKSAWIVKSYAEVRTVVPWSAP
jgi:hypothetical protein